jgi:hypothetical protein
MSDKMDTKTTVDTGSKSKDKIDDGKSQGKEETPQRGPPKRDWNCRKKHLDDSHQKEKEVVVFMEEAPESEINKTVDPSYDPLKCCEPSFTFGSKSNKK